MKHKNMIKNHVWFESRAFGDLSQASKVMRNKINTKKGNPFFWIDSKHKHDSTHKVHDSSQDTFMIWIKAGRGWKKIFYSTQAYNVIRLTPAWFDSCAICDLTHKLQKEHVPICLIWFDSWICVIQLTHPKSQKSKFSTYFWDSTFDMTWIILNYGSCSIKLD